MKKDKVRTFRSRLREDLRDPEFKAHYQEERQALKLAMKITKLREKKGLSQQQMAKLMGTSQQAMEAFLTTFLVFMPTILLSGLMFPVRSMPELFQWLTLANPMRHFLEIVRGIFLKGTGVAPLWGQYLTLLVLGVGMLVFAASRFRKRIG